MSFTIFNPSFSADLSNVSFDLRPGESWFGEGTSELMQACLDAVGVDDAQPASWRSEAFCSPFFSGEGRLEHFRDRNMTAWRVDIQLTSAVSSRYPLPMGRTFVDSVDETAPFARRRKERRWTSRRALVIANFGHGSRLGDLSGPEFGSVRGRETIDHLFDLVQERLDLGVLSFPEDEGVVQTVVDACVARGGRARWAASR
jgi:hypothetical protein